MYCLCQKHLVTYFKIIHRLNIQLIYSCHRYIQAAECVASHKGIIHYYDTAFILRFDNKKKAYALKSLRDLFLSQVFFQLLIALGYGLC